MRPRARRYWGGLLAAGLLMVPAYGASDAWLQWSNSSLDPFLATVSARNRAIQTLTSASTIPALSSATPAISRTAVLGSSASLATSAVNIVSEETYIIVQAGQTLWGIAQKFGVAVEALEAANNLAKRRIEVGQRLVIPGRFTMSAMSAPPATPATPAPSPRTAKQISVVVGDGETLWNIAQTYGVSVDAIIEANTLPNGDVIRPGQRLVIPGGAAEVPTRVALSRRLRSVVSIATSFIWPARGRVTSGFGFRTHPIFGTQEMHTGIDIGAPTGTPVMCARAGLVVSAGYESGYGKTVRIDHGGGLTTVYSHLSTYSVKVGQMLSPGDLIGSVGSTGFSTGPHLLFEIRVHGRPLDPLKYL